MSHPVAPRRDFDRLDLWWSRMTIRYSDLPHHGDVYDLPLRLAKGESIVGIVPIIPCTLWRTDDNAASLNITLDTLGVNDYLNNITYLGENAGQYPSANAGSGYGFGLSGHGPLGFIGGAWLVEEDSRLRAVYLSGGQFSLAHLILESQTADGGTWRATYLGNHVDIAVDASGDATRAALESLPGIGSGGVLPITDDQSVNAGLNIYFATALGPTVSSDMQFSGANLTGPDTPYTLEVSATRGANIPTAGEVDILVAVLRGPG